MSFIFYMNVGPTFLIIKIMIILKDIYPTFVYCQRLFLRWTVLPMALLLFDILFANNSD